MPKHDDGYLSPDCDVPNGMAMLTPLNIRALVFAKYRFANSSAAVWVSQQKAHAEQRSSPYLCPSGDGSRPFASKELCMVHPRAGTCARMWHLLVLTA